MNDGLAFDHVGVVVRDLDASLRYYQKTLGYVWDGQVHVDPLQHARIALLTRPGSDFRIELTEPSGEDSPLAGPLKRGTRLAHVCYRAADLTATLRRFVEQGSHVISEPLPAVAFGGRRVAFLFTSDREIVELVEAGS